ncbi:MAG: transposase [Candidatus Bathyarchaeia archaeon]
MTKEVVAMEVTTDDVDDSEALPTLVKEALKHRMVSEAIMDRSYDPFKVYRLLKRQGIKATIKPRRDARHDKGPPARRRAVRLFKRLGVKAWSKLVGCSRRWSVETTISTFKHMFGEPCMAKERQT